MRFTILFSQKKILGIATGIDVIMSKLFSSLDLSIFYFNRSWAL